MLRDGIDLKEVRNKVTKKRPTSIKEASFQSLTKLFDHISATGNYSYVRQIKDPYALMLILGIKKPIVLPTVEDDPSSQTRISCKVVWNILHSGNKEKLEGLLRRLNVMERYYLEKIASGFHPEGITSKDVFKELSLVRQVDYNDAYYTWILQPDVEVISHSLLSEMTSNSAETSTQRITPALGRFIQPMNFLGGNRNMRFPCIVSPFRVGERVQIHTSLGEYIVFDEKGKELDIEIPEFDNDGVLDAFWDDGELFIFDILCLNDVWLYARPLSERIKLLWRFFPHNETIIPLNNRRELNMWLEKSGDVRCFARNLNSQYCPLDKKNWCIYGEQGVVQLEIAAKGGRNTYYYLVTNDRIPIFTFSTRRINPGERGKIVDVSRSGEILSYRYDLRKGMDFYDVAQAWGLSSPNDIQLDENKRPPKITWRDLKKLL